MWIIILLSLVAFFAASLLISNTVLTVSRYAPSFARLPEALHGFKIVHISDLHSVTLGKDNSRLHAAIDKEAPDIVVLTGDMVSFNEADFEVFFDFARVLKKKYEVYYILGNHEQTLPEGLRSHLCERVRELGVRLLLDESVEITKDGASFMLHGLCLTGESYRDRRYWKGSPYAFSSERMEELLGKSSDGLVDVVLSHNPLYFKEYTKWGADLVLAGHIHGGLWRIPFVGGVFSPNEELFPEYDAGQYEMDGKYMIVSRGLGSNSVWLPRLFNCPDLVVITLVFST